MSAAAIIFFREILEIAVILTVILAATRGVKGRGKWIGLGIVGGLIGSVIVAYFTDAIADMMDGMGQEVFNAAVLFVAVFMIGWTVIWMSTHGRQMAAKLKDVGNKVKGGELPLTAVAVVIALCVWREGAEIVLFMYGIIHTTEEPLINLFIGGAGGTLAAASIGLAMYLGLLKLPMKYFFKTAEWLLILLACGLSAAATGYLIAADVVPAIVYQLWDSSAILASDSLIGQILHALIGYTDRPAAMQLIAYVATLLIILGAMRLVHRSNKQALTVQAA